MEHMPTEVIAIPIFLTEEAGYVIAIDLPETPWQLLALFLTTEVSTRGAYFIEQIQNNDRRFTSGNLIFFDIKDDTVVLSYDPIIFGEGQDTLTISKSDFIRLIQEWATCVELRYNQIFVFKTMQILTIRGNMAVKSSVDGDEYESEPTWFGKIYDAIRSQLPW